MVAEAESPAIGVRCLGVCFTVDAQAQLQGSTGGGR